MRVVVITDTNCDISVSNWQWQLCTRLPPPPTLCASLPGTAKKKTVQKSFSASKFFVFVYFFGGLECVGHSVAYVARVVF